MTDESLNVAVDVSGLQSAVLVGTLSVSLSRLSYWYDPAASAFNCLLTICCLTLPVWTPKSTWMCTYSWKYYL